MLHDTLSSVLMTKCPHEYGTVLRIGHVRCARSTCNAPVQRAPEACAAGPALRYVHAHRTQVVRRLLSHGEETLYHPCDKENALWPKTKIILAKSSVWQNAPARTPISAHSTRHSSPRCGRQTAQRIRRWPHRLLRCSLRFWCQWISRRIPPTPCIMRVGLPTALRRPSLSSTSFHMR